MCLDVLLWRVDEDIKILRSEAAQPNQVVCFVSSIDKFCTKTLWYITLFDHDQTEPVTQRSP